MNSHRTAIPRAAHKRSLQDGDVAVITKSKKRKSMPNSKQPKNTVMAPDKRSSWKHCNTSPRLGEIRHWINKRKG